MQTAQSLVSQGQQTSDTTVRATLSTQYNALRTQIDQLAADSGINGINLLNGNNLTITLNETGSSTVVIAGVTDTSSGALAIAAAANNWAGAADITVASTELSAALVIRSQSQALSSNLQTVQVRQTLRPWSTR